VSRVNTRARKVGSNVAAGAVSFYRRVTHSQSSEFYQLLVVTLFLTGIGVLMVLSASFVDSMKQTNDAFSVFYRQGFVAILGVVVMSIVSLFRVETFKKFALQFALGSIVLQLLTVFTPLGVSVNGNRNWILILGIRIQPSEFLKIAMILIVAAFIESKSRELDDVKNTWLVPLVWGAVLFWGPVLAGKDVGTVIIMAFIMLGMAYLAGVPRLVWLGILGLAAVAVPVIMRSSESRWGRVMAWLNPDAPDPNDYNWQSEHGLWALAAGGINGVGLGQSKLKWSWIPEAENDFIFAIIAEETGLLGALALIIIIVYLAVVLVRISARTDTVFKKMIVLGVMLWITMQSLVNIAVVLRLLPVLGVPLPLISAGGSSLLTILAAIGIVLAIERDNHLRLGSRRRR
jgi:cell division protein FtsW